MTLSLSRADTYIDRQFSELGHELGLAGFLVAVDVIFDGIAPSSRSATAVKKVPAGREFARG